MGAYLSEPITKKVSSDDAGKNVAFGASSMQGWRVSQEDAHNCCIEFDENVSLFAVYDGHGGHEVATYCAGNLPDFIKNTDAYKRGDIKQALIDAFLGFDATLTKPEVVNVLKEIASNNVAVEEKEPLDESDVEENVKNLCNEATMPLEQVMAKYQSEVSNPAVKLLKSEKCSSKHALSASPMLRGRRGRDKAGCSSSGAGCSSASSSWNTDEGDVSSSSQPACESTSSTGADAAQTARPESCPVSSQADQVLDSTTSNGEVAHTSPPVESTADSEPTKSEDMPDSSQDVKGKVTPGKVTQQEADLGGSEVNGGQSKGDFGNADSSKSAGDNVSSSSACVPLENGEAEQQERISSSGRRKAAPLDLYESFLREGEEGSDEDDDEENDVTFDGVSESDDDTEDVDDDDDDESAEGDGDEDVDDDKDDSDDDSDSDDLTMDMTEQPGSDSGCTAVVAILHGKELYVANAGDSRCVLCRDGQALELSFDHKPEDQPEMQRIVKAGGKVTADGRVNGGLNLSRALGDHAYKQNMSLPPDEQMISALPDVRHTTIDPAKDEFMVLACDGIWNFMSSQDVIQFVRTRLNQGGLSISQICEELFNHCLAPDSFGDGTGCDNMTAVIVQFKQTLANAENSSDEPSEAKKRPMSVNNSTDGNGSTAEDESASECKRSKIDTV